MSGIGGIYISRSGNRISYLGVVFINVTSCDRSLFSCRICDLWFGEVICAPAIPAAVNNGKCRRLVCVKRICTRSCGRILELLIEAQCDGLIGSDAFMNVKLEALICCGVGKLVAITAVGSFAKAVLIVGDLLAGKLFISDFY